MSPRDATHHAVMRAVLTAVRDTPLVLKGGSALIFGYGLDRFSEDLDFDSSRRLNLEARIRESLPTGVSLVAIDPLKDTATVTRYRLRYQSEHGERSLRIEVSYRTPPEPADVTEIQGLRIASLPRLVDQKLRAAHDGEDPRSKVRDLYDLSFIANHWPEIFTEELAARLRAYAGDPSGLVARYQADYREDDLIADVADLEDLAIRLHYRAEEIAQQLSSKRDRQISP